jgi:hypothetical protein
MAEANTPTVRQMRARMSGGHRQILEALVAGRGVTTRDAASARGLQTCRATLIGWGCVADGAITATGHELLREYYRVNPGAKPSRAYGEVTHG